MDAAQGSPVWLTAFANGIMSSVSLPLGAVVALLCGPIAPTTCGRFMAFGSGALIHAVTVQLYGESLCRLQASADPLCRSIPNSSKRQHFTNGMVMVVTGFAGSLTYMVLQEYLEKRTKLPNPRRARAVSEIAAGTPRSQPMALELSSTPRQGALQQDEADRFILPPESLDVPPPNREPAESHSAGVSSEVT